MSPDDIDQVLDCWQRALTEPDLLHRAIADRLVGSPSFRSERAAWIVRSVSCLSPDLDHPTAFVPTAVVLIASRFPVTLDELAAERDALLGALEERCGPLSAETAQAWNLAIELFAEIVSSIGLDPFACAEDRGPVAALRPYP